MGEKEEKKVEVKETKTAPKKEAKTEKKCKKGIIVGSIIAVVVIAAIVVGIVIAYNNGLIGTNYKKLAGKYEIVAMQDEEQEYTIEDINMLKKFGITFGLELNEDGTGAINLFGSNMELTYNGRNLNYQNELIPYKVENGKIIIETEAAKITFEKVVEE